MTDLELYWEIHSSYWVMKNKARYVSALAGRQFPEWLTELADEIPADFPTKPHFDAALASLQASWKFVFKYTEEYRRLHDSWDLLTLEMGRLGEACIQRLSDEEKEGALPWWFFRAQHIPQEVRKHAGPLPADCIRCPNQDCRDGGVACADCGGSGKPRPGYSCTPCDGKGWMVCSTCDGRRFVRPEELVAHPSSRPSAGHPGLSTAPDHSSASVGEIASRTRCSCSDGRVPCDHCGMKGYIEIVSYNAGSTMRTRIDCTFCTGGWSTHHACKGTGYAD